MQIVQSFQNIYRILIEQTAKAVKKQLRDLQRRGKWRPNKTEIKNSNYLQMQIPK